MKEIRLQLISDGQEDLVLAYKDKNYIKWTVRDREENLIYIIKFTQNSRYTVTKGDFSIENNSESIYLFSDMGEAFDIKFEEIDKLQVIFD